jgi:hypothetical protein
MSRSNSQFGSDPTQMSTRAVGAVGVGIAGGIATAVGLGIVNAMNARSLADGRAITIADWHATVTFLEAHCHRFTRWLRERDETIRDRDKTIKVQAREILQLRAELEIAKFRAQTRH